MRAAGLEVVADILETEVQFTSLISIVLQGFGSCVLKAPTVE